MLPRPAEMERPVLTQAQARRLAHMQRSGHFIVGYEAITGDDFTAVTFVTSRREFHVREDGTDLDAAQVASLPARPSSGRRRSLRNPGGEQRSTDVQG